MNRNPLITKLRGLREGAQFEHFFRAICFVLHGWCAFRSSTTGERAALAAIPFDKLVLFFVRIWNDLYARNAKDVITFTESTGNFDPVNLITFPCPVTVLPGKHGRGAAVQKEDGSADFILTVIAKLNAEGIGYYFELTPGGSSRDPVESASHPETTVGVAVPVQDAATFLDGFSEREIATLSDLSRSLRRLTPSQLRALGTHSDAISTHQDAVKEYEYITTKRIVEELKELINSDEAFSEIAHDLYEFADEGCRKSRENRDDYSAAWSILDEEISDPILRSAFQAKQSRADVIWRHNSLSTIFELSARCRTVALYLHAVSGALAATAKGNVSAFLKQQLKDRGDDVNRLGVGSFPDSVRALHDDDGKLHPHLKRQFCITLDDLQAQFPR